MRDLGARKRSLDLVRRAVVLGTPALVHRPAELAAQLSGRLPSGVDAGVDDLLSRVTSQASPVWFEPVYPSLRHASGELACTLEGHEAPVRAAVFTSDGRVVSGSEDGTIRVWDTGAGRPLQVWWHGAPIGAVGLSADERTVVAIGAGGSATIWDLDLGERRAERRVPDGPLGAEVVVDGDGETTFTLSHQDRDPEGRPRAASASGDVTVVGTDEVWSREKNDIAWGTVEVEDRRTGRHDSLRGHRGTVEAVTIAADGALAVSRDMSGVVRIWDLEASTTILSVQGATGAIALSRSGLVLTAGSDGTMRVWAPGIVSSRLGHHVPVAAVAIAQSAGIAVSIANHGQEDLWMWDLSGASAPRHRWVNLAEASAVAVSADGRWAVVGYEAGESIRWSLDADPNGKDSAWDSGWSSGPSSYEDRDVARESWVPTEEVAVADDGTLALSKSDDLRRHSFELGDVGVDAPEDRWEALEAALEARGERRRAIRPLISGPTVSVAARSGSPGRATFTVDGSEITAWEATPETLVIGDDTGSVHILRCHGLDPDWMQPG